MSIKPLITAFGLAVIAAVIAISIVGMVTDLQSVPTHEQMQCAAIAELCDE